jgi:RNA polymerase-binding transcription factor DksA
VTGKPIAPERLEARPTARTNVATEGQREAGGRLPHGGAGDPEEY